MIQKYIKTKQSLKPVGLSTKLDKDDGLRDCLLASDDAEGGESSFSLLRPNPTLEKEVPKPMNHRELWATQGCP